MHTDLQLVVARLNIVEEENNELKEKLNNLAEKKMLLELSTADTIDVLKTKLEHKMLLDLSAADTIDALKIKLEEYRLKLRKMRRYVIHKEAWFHYAVGSIVTLAAIFFGVVILFGLSR